MKSTPDYRSFLRLGAVALMLATTLPAFAEEAAALLWDQPSTELPDWVRNQTIYEINVRQYSEAGTLDAVTADLDRIEELGVRTLWLMPIHPIGKVNRKGELGSYYSISDYMDINPEFGTKADFKEFVDAAHARGMRVILDWVGNHTAWDNPIAKEHPEYFMTDDEGNFIPPLGFDWTDVIQVDYNNEDLLKYQIKAMRFWIEEFGVDGYRCDYATGIPTPFWNKLSAALLEIRPDLFMLAEAEVPDQQLKAFHASYGWPLMHAFNDVAQGKKPASWIDDVQTRMDLEFPAGSDFLLVTSNHDENSWNGTVFERLGGGVEVFAALTYVMDGIPLIYNGQEAGLDRRLEFFQRDPIDWKEHRLFDVYKRLNDLKTKHPALATGADSIRIPSTLDEQAYVLLRKAGKKKVLLLANLSAADIDFRAGSKLLAGKWKDAFTGEKVVLGKSPTFELNAWKYQLLISD